MDVRLGIFLFIYLWTLVNGGSGVLLKDGDITYEFEKSHVIGVGACGCVYLGSKTEGEYIEAVAMKVSKSEIYNFHINHERNIYEVLNVHGHESIPKFYKYFPVSNDNNEVILVTELLGKNIEELFIRAGYFSVVTTMKIGLQVLDTLEHMHKHNVIHFDVADRNLALGVNNDSRIYLFDFNFAQEYRIVNDSIKLQDNLIKSDFYLYKQKSPRRDLTQLTVILKKFLGKSWFGHPLTPQWVIDRVAAHREIIDLLIEYEIKTLESDSIYPDYQALRNILETELEKHRNEPNFDKFDWQITGDIARSA